MAEKNSLWKNIRNKAAQNKRTGATPKKPTREMLNQERKIKAKHPDGGPVNTLEGDLISKVIMNRNRDKDFVKRAYAVGEYPESNMFVQPDANEFGQKNSHLMGWGEDESGQAYMYPEVMNPNNEAVKVPNQYADYISSTGYKKAAGMQYAKGSFVGEDDKNKNKTTTARDNTNVTSRSLEEKMAGAVNSANVKAQEQKEKAALEQERVKLRKFLDGSTGSLQNWKDRENAMQKLLEIDNQLGTRSLEKEIKTLNKAGRIMLKGTKYFAPEIAPVIDAVETWGDIYQYSKEPNVQNATSLGLDGMGPIKVVTNAGNVYRPFGVLGDIYDVNNIINEKAEGGYYPTQGPPKALFKGYAQGGYTNPYNQYQDDPYLNYAGGGYMYGNGGRTLKNIGAGAFGVLEGLVDTTFGWIPGVDYATDMAYKGLQKIGGSSADEIREQDSIHGYGQTAGAVGSAILTSGATTGAAISESAQGLGQGISKGNESEKWARDVGTGLNIAGTVVGTAYNASEGAKAAKEGFKLSQAGSEGIGKFAAAAPKSASALQAAQTAKAASNLDAAGNVIGSAAPEGTKIITDAAGNASSIKPPVGVLAPPPMPVAPSAASSLAPNLSTAATASTNLPTSLPSTSDYSNLGKIGDVTSNVSDLPKSQEPPPMAPPMSAPPAPVQQPQVNYDQFAVNPPTINTGFETPDYDFSYNPSLPTYSQGGNMLNNSLNLRNTMRYKRFAKGGAFDQYGINMIPDSAGLHHESAYGGVPIGPDALAEGGEIKMNTEDGSQYIVSDEVDGAEIQKDFTFSKGGKYKELNRTLADGMKQDLNKYTFGSLATSDRVKGNLRRPNDSYAQSTIDQIKNKWQQKTEYARQRSQQEQAIAQAENQKRLAEEEYIAAYGGKINPKKYPGLNYAKGGIHIKPENKGKFTASAEAAGHTVQEHARAVLNNPNATPLQKKRANFARNAAKWHHADGGYVHNQMIQPMLAEGGPIYGDPASPYTYAMGGMYGDPYYRGGQIDYTNDMYSSYAGGGPMVSDAPQAFRGPAAQNRGGMLMTYADGGMMPQEQQMQQAPQEQMQQQGGQDQMMQMVQQIAQAIMQGKNPEQLMAELANSGMPKEQVQQIMQAAMQMVDQQQQQQPQGQPMQEGQQMPPQQGMARGGYKYAEAGPVIDPAKLKAEGYVEYDQYFYNPKTGQYVDKPSTNSPELDAAYQKNLEKFMQPGFQVDASYVKPMAKFLNNTGADQMPIDTGIMTYDISKGVKKPGMENVIGPDTFEPGTLYNMPNTNPYGSKYDLQYEDPYSFSSYEEQQNRYPILDREGNIQTTPEQFNKLQSFGSFYQTRNDSDDFTNRYNQVQSKRDKIKQALQSNFKGANPTGVDDRGNYIFNETPPVQNNTVTPQPINQPNLNRVISIDENGNPVYENKPLKLPVKSTLTPYTDANTSVNPNDNSFLYRQEGVPMAPINTSVSENKATLQGPNIQFIPNEITSNRYKIKDALNKQKVTTPLSGFKPGITFTEPELDVTQPAEQPIATQPTPQIFGPVNQEQPTAAAKVNYGATGPITEAEAIAQGYKPQATTTPVTTQSGVTPPIVTDRELTGINNRPSWVDIGIGASQLAGAAHQFFQKKPEPFKYDKMQATTLNPTPAIVAANQAAREAQALTDYNIKQNAPTSGSYLANIRANALQSAKQRGAAASGIQQQYDIQNAGILNQMEQQNTEIENRNIDAIQQDLANFQEQRTNALYNAGANIAGMRRDYKANEINQTIANNIGTSNYKLISDGKGKYAVVYRDVNGAVKTMPYEQVAANSTQPTTTAPAATQTTQPNTPAQPTPYTGPMSNYLNNNQTPDYTKPPTATLREEDNSSFYGSNNYEHQSDYVKPPEKTDKETIKAFQDWLDLYHPDEWTNSGKPLNKGKGYGNFGEQTDDAWYTYGKEFMGKVPFENRRESIPRDEYYANQDYYDSLPLSGLYDSAWRSIPGFPQKPKV